MSNQRKIKLVSRPYNRNVNDRLGQIRVGPAVLDNRRVYIDRVEIGNIDEKKKLSEGSGSSNDAVCMPDPDEIVRYSTMCSG